MVVSHRSVSRRLRSDSQVALSKFDLSWCLCKGRLLCNGLVRSSKIVIRMVVVVSSVHKRIVVLVVGCDDFQTILVRECAEFRAVRSTCVVRHRLYV